MENKKNQNVKKHKNIVLYQNIGGHKGSTKTSVRNKVVGGICRMSDNLYYVK
jgi:hypothetical protein